LKYFLHAVAVGHWISVKRNVWKGLVARNWWHII
jgi:hypothetical protein